MLNVEYELDRFDNNRDELTQYHQAVWDGSPRKSPIKHNNTCDVFNIETNTAQPDDIPIGAATAAISTVPDPTVFTATKAAVGATPDSSTTITATPTMMTLVGVTAVSQQQPIKRKRETLDFNSTKGVWGRQLGNIPQANIGDIYLPAGGSLNPSQMQQLYTIISALEGINVQPKYFAELASKNWNVIHTKLLSTTKTGLGGKMRPALAKFLLRESYHNFTHIQATQKLASIVPVVAPRNKFPPPASMAVPIPTAAEISSMTQRPMKNLLRHLDIGIPKTNSEMKAKLMNHYYPTSNLI